MSINYRLLYKRGIVFPAIRHSPSCLKSNMHVNCIISGFVIRYVTGDLRIGTWPMIDRHNLTPGNMLDDNLIFKTATSKEIENKV